MFSKSALVLTTAAAIALTSFDLRPAQAAPESSPAIGKQNGADEFSAQGKRRRGRGVHPGVPLVAFGAIVGTIAGIAAAERRREYYERPYAYGTPYGYAPQVYAPQVLRAVLRLRAAMGCRPIAITPAFTATPGVVTASRVMARRSPGKARRARAGYNCRPARGGTPCRRGNPDVGSGRFPLTTNRPTCVMVDA